MRDISPQLEVPNGPDPLSARAPFWSVMIPTYRPSPDYLRQTIEGVLSQGIPPEELQLEVVDDATPNADIAGLVKSICGDRAKVWQNPCNQGLAGCWNSCVERARGDWVHLLHQDDLIFPGFYVEMRKLVESQPTAGAAFCRHCILDQHSMWTHLSVIESRERSLLTNWPYLLSTAQRIQCPAMVVRRDVYREVGHYRADLPYCLDWEMWVRIAVAYSVAYTPAILAGYRVHDRSETSRLQRSATPVLDQINAFELIVTYLPAEVRSAARREFTHRLSPWLMRQIIEAYVAQRFEVAAETIHGAASLALPAHERREIRRIARNIHIKRWLKRLGMYRSGHSAAPEN